MITTDQLYQVYLKHPHISTDTRKIEPGSIFFALKGDKFNANTFAEQAIASGAAYAVIDEPVYNLGSQYLLVENVITALQDLARYHRRQLKIPVIGLTGSNGKTTTKELINAVLSQHFQTFATQGNLNNHIGVPLSILSINDSHQMAVIEMGANHQKEIAFLSSICQPTHGLITNVGKAHLEGFGGVEGVKKGKGELYDYLKDAGAVAFVNSDDKVLMEMQQTRELTNVVLYGNKPGSLVSAQITDNSPYLTLQWVNNQTGITYVVKSQLTGTYNIDNILTAICIGLYFKLSAEQINAGISGYQPKNNRSQITTTATNTLICDYYNANPSSMVVAIENIAKIQADCKVLVLGDMFEMGDESTAEHKAVLDKAMYAKVDKRIFVGEEFYKLGDDLHKAEDSAIFYRTTQEAIAGLKANPIKNAAVLLKGSRGMALEKLVELF